MRKKSMAGDPQQKNKPELLCGVAPKIADGSVTDRVGEPPPGALPECEQRPHRFGLQLSARLGTATIRGKGNGPWGVQSHSQRARDERERNQQEGNIPPGGWVTNEPTSRRTAAAAALLS